MTPAEILELARANMSKTKSIGFTGRHHTDETKRRISDAMKVSSQRQKRNALGRWT